MPEQVLVEEENESVDEDNSFGLQVPPAFVSELYHGAEDSTESTHQSNSQEDASNGDSSLSQEAPKVRHQGCTYARPDTSQVCIRI